MTRVSTQNIPAVLTLLIINAIMAISQTNIASIYRQISIGFHQSIYGLGVLTSVYFAAYGLLEIPGGVAAVRFGSKNLVIAGGLLTAVGLLGGSLSPSFSLLEISRALAGVGYGILFAPALVLVGRNLGSASVGLGVALSTVSFSLGGFGGILGWALLSEWAGWRASLVIEFALTLGSVLAVIPLVPRDQPRPDFLKWSRLKNVITGKPTLALAFSVFGGGATSILTGSFLVYYLEESLGITAGSAGSIGALTYVAPLLTGIIAGRLYDKGTGAKVLLALSVVLMTCGTAVVAYPSLYTAILGSVVCGFGVGAGGTAAFSAARDLSPGPEYESLHVSLIDSASLVGLFIAPLFFSVAALEYGYPIAWLIGSLSAVIGFLPLLVVRLGREDNEGRLGS